MWQSLTFRRILNSLTALALCLLASRPAAAQIVANGVSLTVTTANAVATFTGPDLTGFVNSATGETYLKNPSSGNLAGINSFTSSGAWTTSNWTIGTEAGTGVPLATITAQDTVRSLTMTVKIDSASQEVVLRLSASVTSPGMRQAWWSLAGLDVNGGRLIVPANSGMVFDKSHPIDTFVLYPNNWHAQMAVYETAQSSLLVYSTDTQIAFKRLRATTRGESTIDVTLGTEATAPFGTATTVPTVEWRLKAFVGTWRPAAQVYRDWLNTNRPPISNAAHPWVSNIRTVVTLRTLEPSILTLLAAQVAPAQTLLYLVDWRVDPFDVNYPDYTPRAGVSNFVASARALGFKVMLHLDILGVSPFNPDYNAVKAWHARGAELLEPLGWNWNQSTSVRYAFINLAAPAYRSLFINRVSVAVNALAPDALHLDISGPMINDGNGLINGMSYAQGSAQLHQELKAAFPTVALGGEGENDVIYRYHSFAQSWWLTTANVGHPIAAYLFSPQVQYYGHLGQPAARESGFKNYAAELGQRAMHPTLPVMFPSDLDTSHPDNARLLTWLRSWQTHAFAPAWTADWTGALVRYQGTGGSTAALTDTGTKMTLTAAGSTLFTLAHDTNHIASPPYPSRWFAFDGANTYGLDPSKRYFLDQSVPPASTHVTALPAGVRIGPGSLVTSSVAHVELLPSASESFDFQALLTADMGVRYNGSDFALGFGALVQLQTQTAGGQTRSGIFIHPPWQGQVSGETFVEYSLPVPVGASLQFDVSVADAATCTDGVTFRVTASGTELWREHITRTGWQHRSVSLSAYGGSTIPLRIISNPGPANNPNCDWSMWNQVSVIAPSAQISAPLLLAPGSIPSGFAGNGSLALNGLSGIVSNLPVPGHFTVFTQPGTPVFPGSNLANIPFDVWNGAHGEVLVPGSVAFAGNVGSFSSGGVVKNPAIFASPPGFGRSVLSWVIRLPAVPQRLSWSIGLLDGSSSGDGVDFQVAINGVTRWQRTSAATQWIPGVVDLSPWAGQTILVELLTDSIEFAAFDHAVWADLVLSDAVIPGDLNGDGMSDLIWRNPTTGGNTFWLLNGTNVIGQLSLPSVADPTWQLVATGDVNRDGQVDVIWRNQTTGANVVWYLNGGTYLGQASLPTVADRSWVIGAANDVNRDGWPDLIWRNLATGSNVVWYLNGSSIAGTVALPSVSDQSWQIAASADMNQDGFPDVIWRNVANGANVVWYLSNGSYVGQANLPAFADLAWRLVGAFDINKDQRSDLIWHNTLTGANVVWYMAGTTVISNASFPTVADPTWQLMGTQLPEVTADVNGDRHPDLVWRNSATGANVVWYTNGVALLGHSALPSVPDSTWRIEARADVNGDRHPDLIWRNAVSGANVVWFLNGTSLVGNVSLPSVADTNWHIVAAPDLNADTHPDLIWRNSVTGANVVWYLNGVTLLGTASLTTVPDLTWTIVDAADMNGDTYPDLIWRNTTSGANVIWYLQGVSVVGQGSLPSVPDATWQLVAVMDEDGDGHPDLVWRNTASGANAVWFMNGATLLYSANLPTVSDLNWTLRVPGS